MNISPSLVVALVFATTLIVLFLKERSLYVLFLAAYTHSIVVPVLYTHGYIGADMARGLLLLKDILLFELFVCGPWWFCSPASGAPGHSLLSRSWCSLSTVGSASWWVLSSSMTIGAKV